MNNFGLKNLTLWNIVIYEVDIWLANPQVRMEVVLRVVAVHQVFVVTYHGPLLKPRTSRTLKGHTATMTVTQVVHLQQKTAIQTILDTFCFKIQL